MGTAKKQVERRNRDDDREKPVARARMLPTSDGRTQYARLVAQTFEALVAHIGGDSVASVTQRIAARRIASLEASLVQQECKFAEAHAAGDAPSADAFATYGMLADRQRRLCQSLGWRPTARDVTPDLTSYIQQPRSHYDDGNV